MKATKQSSVKNWQGPGLLLLCSRVSLGKAAGSEPHLTSFIAEFSDCPTGLLHCFCLSLGLMSQGKYTKGSSKGLNVRAKPFCSEGSTGQEPGRQSLLRAGFPDPAGQGQGWPGPERVLVEQAAGPALPGVCG